MSKFFDPKVIFIAIFLLLSIAIEKSENFQLRDFNDGVSDSAGVGKAVLSGKVKTKVRFPFRKLEKVENDEDDDDDDDEQSGESNDDNDDSEEDTSNYKFAKVRKPTFEVKKRSNLRRSKLAQFREPSDLDDDDDDDESGEKVSFFSRVLSFFKSKPKEETVDESESQENAGDESAESDDDASDDDENESGEKEDKKPLLSEIFGKFKDFLEAREKKSKVIGEISDSGEAASDSDDDDEDATNANKVNEVDEPETIADSKIKISIRETFNKIFNRLPFNLIFDFDDADDSQAFEESEEDEINYQRLLKEEREQERLSMQTEQLIKQSSEEDAVKHEVEAEHESSDSESKQTSTQSTPKREKKTKEQAHLAKKEFEKLILNLPSFVPDYSKVKNPECQKQGEVFQRQLRGQRIWALEMMDANAKIPSGLMRGNTNQLGDFDLCTKISQKIKISDTNSMKMKGKYCLANIDVVAAADQLKLPVHLIQGRNFIRSTINDVSVVVSCPLR